MGGPEQQEQLLRRHEDARSAAERKAEWAFAAAIILLGLTTLLFTSINLRYFLDERPRTSSEAQLSLVLMAIAILIAIGVVVVTSYVVRLMKAEARIRLEMERLQSKAELADSLRELRHDYDNQLTVILALLQLGRVERAVDYLQGIVGRRPHLMDAEASSAVFAFLGEKGLEAVENRVAVRYELEPCPFPEVPVDVITRIVGNLFDNAVEAAVQAEERGEVRARVFVRDGRWWFEIWNNGASIPPGMLQRIFESGVTTKREAEGHGLGLVVVRRLVDTHQGQITVESHPELGTTFTVSFELAPVYSSSSHDR